MPATLVSDALGANAGLGFDVTDATGAEITRAAKLSSKVIITTATTLSLTITQHASRTVYIQTNSSSGFTGTLPVAIGSGARFKLVNYPQTQGTITVTAQTGDVIKGMQVALDSTASADASSFLTTATSIKAALNRTTTGGLGYDEFEFEDIAANIYQVRLITNGSGTLATSFSA